ncbi:amino acid-binding ACT domain-containing protein [Pedobacter sp. HMF7647]|uniref:Amino acid-binding ACT domain-containing protein n=1 Tax=Hufsiella arboris TaxID=2695275 RepID=A0A7K1Y816_9SPHI|nr:amino acid-binding ACT domain-containing protein [Hufsiella arboris]MXV50733.1 amino acid-binding ACT domain-containing protein [Hufsiella arboris]
MYDIEIVLENRPGSLALMGEILGTNNISLEGGGVFAGNEKSTAHFLIMEPEKARKVLGDAGFDVLAINEVIIQKLRQDLPGQLGLFCRRLADENVNILVQYSDHANQLILVVDNPEKARAVSDKWMKEFWN